MSHISTVDLMIKDLESKAKACGKLGLELVRGQKTFRGYTQGRCDHAIRVIGQPQAYEIGLCKRADGKGYDLKWDGGMGAYAPAKLLYDRVGYEAITYGGKPPSMDKLKDWYAAEVARKQMTKQGFMVRTIQKGRKVQVLCSK
jgi:hypothetical protein